MVLSKNNKAQAWFPLDDVRMYRRYEVVWCGELSSEVSRSATDALTQKIRATRREEHQQGWSKRDRGLRSPAAPCKGGKGGSRGVLSVGRKRQRPRNQESCSTRVLQSRSENVMSLVTAGTVYVMPKWNSVAKLSFQGYVRCIQKQMTVKLLRHRNTWPPQLSIIRIYTSCKDIQARTATQFFRPEAPSRFDHDQSYLLQMV